MKLNKMPTASIASVDWRRADDLLLANDGNRMTRPAWLRELRRIIRAGEWKLTNDAVTISTDGAVTNGQHRLFAISEERVPTPGLPLMLLEGVDRDDRIAYDQGKPRDESDLLQLRGYTGDGNHVAIARMMVIGERTFASRVGAVDWTIARWTDVKFAYNLLARYMNDPSIRGLSRSGVAGVLARAHASLPAARVDDLIRFADRLMRGASFRRGADRDAAVDELRARIIRDWNTAGARKTQRDIFWDVQSVLYAWLDGRTFNFETDPIRVSHLFSLKVRP